MITALAADAATTTGKLEGTIGGTALDVDGTCSLKDGQFQFWSDGRDFPVNMDSDGDGMYINITVRSMGDRTFAALRYGRGGEKVYNGSFDLAAWNDRSISVDTSMGGDHMPAKFQVQCP